jgi:hypothetical protein
MEQPLFFFLFSARPFQTGGGSSSGVRLLLLLEYVS